MTGLCYVPRKSEQGDNHDSGENSRTVQVKVNGKVLTALLDSGSSMSFVRKQCVPCVVDYSRQTNVLCVHGDCKPEPQVELTVEVDGQKYLMKVGVVENLPVEMLLGWDLPVLCDLLSKGDCPCNPSDLALEPKMNVSCFAMTRSQAKAQAQSGVQPLPDLCGSLCEAGTKGPRKTRRQRRLEKHAGAPESVETPNNDVSVQWEIPENIKMLQQSDPLLKSLLTKVVTSADHTFQSGGSVYVLHNDVLYQGKEPNNLRLVVPASCRSLVLHLAHTGDGSAAKRHFQSKQPSRCPHQNGISPRRSTISSVRLPLSCQISNSLSLSHTLCLCVCVCVCVCMCVCLCLSIMSCAFSTHILTG